MQQAVSIHEPEARPGFRLGQTIRDKCGAQKISNTNARRTGTQLDNLLLAKAASRDAKSGEDGSDGNSRRALNIVVEGNQLVAIPIQDGPGVGLGEILPLKQSFRQFALHRLDKKIDELIVGAAGDPFVTPTQIFRVGQAFLIVGPDVEDHRQGLRGGNPANQRVERKFSDGNAQSPNALITDAKDALAIGDDNDAYFLVGAILQELLDVLAEWIRDDEAAGTPVDVAEFLARFRHDGRVNDRKHLLDMIEEQAIKEDFVGVLQLPKVNVPFEIVRLSKKGFVRPKGLFFDGLDRGREKAVQAKSLPFGQSESRALVQCRSFQKPVPAKTRREPGRG